MATRDEVIRFLIQTAGDKELSALAREMEALAKSGEGAGEDIDAFVSELDKLAGIDRNISKLTALKAEMAETATAFDAAKGKVAGLEKQFDAAELPTQKLKDSMAKARAEVKLLAAEQNKQRAALASTEIALRNAGVSTDKLATAQRDARQEITNLTGRWRDYVSQQNAATAAQEKANASAGRGIDVFGRLRSVLASIGVALGLREAARGVGSILEVGDAAEKTRIKLEALYGSAEAGNKAFDELKQLAEQNGQAMQSTIDAAAKLKGFGIDPLNGSLQGLIDQNAKLGGSQETLNGIIMAVGQAWAKQKLQGEEILQLVERGVPVWDLLAQATGKNVTELQKMSAAGELGRDVIASLLQEIGKSAEGQAARGLSTLSGLVTQAKNAFANFLQQISDAGVLDYFKQQLVALNAEVKALGANGTLKSWAVGIRDAIVGTSEAIKSSVGFVREYSGAILLLAKAYVALKVAQAGAALASGISAIGAAAGSSVGKVTAFVAGVQSIGATAAVTGVANNVAAAVAGLAKSLQGFIVAGTAVGGYEVGALLGEKLNELYLRATDAGDSLSELENSLRDSGDAAAAAADKWSNYSNVTLKTAQEVSKLNEEQRSAYAQQLEGLENLLVAQGKELAAKRWLGEATAEEIEQLAQVKDRLADVRESMLAVSTAGAELEQSFQGSELSAEAKAVADAMALLEVNVKSASSGITKEGFALIAAFDAIAESAESSARQVGMAFESALSKVTTREEVEALGRSINDAFARGKISIQDYGIAMSLVDERLKQLDLGKTAFGKAESESQKATQAIVAQWEAVRAGLAVKAAALQASLAEAFAADPNYNGPLLQQYRDIDAQILALNTSINEGKKSLDSLGDSGQSAGTKIEGGIGKASSALRDAASAAGDAASGVEKTSEAATAGNGVVGAYINRLVQLKEEFNATSAAAEDLFTRFQTAQGGGVGQSLTDLFQDLEDAGIQTRIELANASTAADLLSRDLREVGDVTDAASYAAIDFGNRFGGNLARAGEEAARLVQDIEAVQNGAENARDDLKLLDRATLDQLKSEAQAAADAVAGIGDEAKSALEELQSLNRELQDEADRAAGNESAVLERQHQDRLAQIEELAATAGAAGAAEAAEARRRSEEQFAREMEQIAAKRAAEREAAAEREQSDRRRAAVTSTVTSARTQGSQLPTPGGIVINISGDALDADALVRKLKPSLDRITRLYTGAR